VAVATTLAISAASRPYPGEVENGDAWQVDWHANSCRIAVVDGLGHGSQAAAAARAACHALAERPELSPPQGLRLCHDALASTRGAAISIASIELDTSRLVYSGVGNVDAHLWQGGRQERLVGYRGIVGRTLPTLRDFSFSLQPEWVLLIHTDGVSGRFRVETLFAELLTNPQQLAQHILEGWGRKTDDATVVVIRPTI
jgi:serine phosphatase RsbU (regulator of sigma subunit)